MSTTVSYKGDTIATVNNNTKVLKTGGTWLEDDITLVDVTSGGGGSPVISPLSVTENGTYTAPSGIDGYSPVTVNVSGGGGGGWDADDIASRDGIDGVAVCSTSTKLYPYCFAYTKITSFQSDTVVSLENTDSTAQYFLSAKSLTSVSMPNVEGQIGIGAFRYCSALTSVNIPNGVLGRIHIFNECTSLKEVVFPKTPTVANSVFLDCTALEKVDLGSPDITTAGNIAANAFSGCTKLNVLILRKGVAYGLDNINAFNNTPFASGGTGGTLYVPNSLISSYQAIANWATILGYASNNIQKIEGSIYE